MIKKIVFIEPKSPERHVFSRWKLPRLGTVVLATRLKQAGYDVKVFAEEVAPVDYEAFFSADLVGISTITSTAPRAYEFARAARRAGIPVVMGGPHVTFLPDEALQSCDYVFRGEADDLIVDLVRCIESGHGLETFPSLSYHAGDKVVHNPLCPSSPDVDSLPGFESVSPTVLKGYEKRQSVEQMELAIRELHQRRIRIHGMFIFGGDLDTSETFRETVRFARSHHIESAQFMILVPLPGTPVFDEMDRQGRLLSRDWSLYDAHHVVFEPKNMSTFELQVETLRAFCRFYSLWPALRRLIKADFFSLAIKLWGRHAARECRRRLADYVEVTRQWAHRTGHRVELRARQTAEDVKIAAARFNLDGLRARRQPVRPEAGQ
jgi:radical SAM superfamily enzyme YgiQ (UPF0313 family)